MQAPLSSILNKHKGRGQHEPNRHVREGPSRLTVRFCNVNTSVGMLIMASIRSLSKILAVTFPVMYRLSATFYFHFVRWFWDPIWRTTVQQNANIIDLEEICQGCGVGQPRSSRQRCECDHCTENSVSIPETRKC